jgi:hypothetical protein
MSFGISLTLRFRAVPATGTVRLAPLIHSHLPAKVVVVMTLLLACYPVGAQHTNRKKARKGHHKISLVNPNIKRGSVSVNGSELQTRPEEGEADETLLLTHGVYVGCIKASNAWQGPERLLFVRFSDEGTFYACSIMRPPDVAIERLLAYEHRFYLKEIGQIPSFADHDLRASSVKGKYRLNGKCLKFQGGIECSGTLVDSLDLQLTPSVCGVNEKGDEPVRFHYDSGCGRPANASATGTAVRW